jgi:hypothetical protein
MASKLDAADFAVVENGTRWARNILVELNGNYGKHLPSTARADLKTAVEALGRLDISLGDIPPEIP